MLEFDTLEKWIGTSKTSLFQHIRSIVSYHIDAFKKLKGSFFKAYINLYISLGLLFLVFAIPFYSMQELEFYFASWLYAIFIFPILFFFVYVTYNNFVVKLFDNKHVVVGDSLNNLMHWQYIERNINFLYHSMCNFIVLIISSLWLFLVSFFVLSLINGDINPRFSEMDYIVARIIKILMFSGIVLSFYFSIKLIIKSFKKALRFPLLFLSSFLFISRNESGKLNKDNFLEIDRMSILVVKNIGIIKFILLILLGSFISFKTYGIYYPLFCYILFSFIEQNSVSLENKCTSST